MAAKYKLRTDTPTHGTIRKRLLRYRGSAKDHPCIRCGKDAKYWGLQFLSEHNLIDVDGYIYSREINEYAPFCPRCLHVRRHELNVRHEIEPQWFVCEWCSREYTAKPNPKGNRWCSRKCRQAGWAANRNKAA